MGEDPGCSEYHGGVFRHASARHAGISEQLLRHTQRVGYRFNPPGEFGAIYLALDEDTAKRELRRLAAHNRQPLSELMPRVMITARVHLQCVLDLRDERQRKRYGITLEEIGAGDWSACQAVARLARAEGYEAVRFPSATGAGENLALFLDRMIPGSSLEVVTMEDLHPDLV
jgi:RES domain-containing protein